MLDSLPRPLPDYLSVAAGAASQDVLDEVAGRFYTPAPIGEYLAAAAAGPDLPAVVAVVDPFGGDGRLVEWFIRYCHRQQGRSVFHAEVWDVDETALSQARARLSAVASELGVHVTAAVRQVDSYREIVRRRGTFDVVITNPPWENLKPDRRLLERLNPEKRNAYVDGLRSTDAYLQSEFPYSQPTRKFAGWGTNLARAGIEASWQLLRPTGVLAAVTPASFLADDVSSRLRKYLLSTGTLRDIAYYPAETRLFKADVTSTTVVLIKTPTSAHRPGFSTFDRSGTLASMSHINLDVHLSTLARGGWSVPIGFGATAASVYQTLGHLPTLGDLEGDRSHCLWAGRELDETGVSRYLTAAKSANFVKGFMIRRFGIASEPRYFVTKPNWHAPASTSHTRIAWRDISRPNQVRRVHATVIPAGWVAGNSLGVAYFRNDDLERLFLLLGIMSSVGFEIQLRAFLATGHVTLGALRRVHIPDLDSLKRSSVGTALIDAVRRCLLGDPQGELDVELAAATAYSFDPQMLEAILGAFVKLQPTYRESILHAFEHR